MDLSRLNPQQREAVMHRGSPLLILAGAGSGKTRVITTRVAHLLHTGDAKPEQILAVTFTNRAAQEMRERVASQVGEDSARILEVSTFHSFCARLLRSEINRLGYSKKFTIYDASDQRALLARCLSEFSIGKESFDIGYFAYRIGRSKNRGLSPETYEPFSHDKYDERVPALWHSYQKALQARDAVDFDDLLLLSHRLLSEHHEVLQKVRKHYRHVLIDEYQDTNTLQFEIARKICEEHRNLCVVGDDDQSIYGFRGAEVSNILDFERHFPDARIITLDRNYRSTETILKAANSVISRNLDRRTKTLWSQEGEGRRIELVSTEDENDEATYVALQIKELRVHHGLSWSDFGVLYRSNIQSRPYEIAFRKNQLPYVVIGGMEFFDRKEVKDIASYLRVLANPKDDISLRRIINVPRRGIGDTALQRLNEAASASHRPLYDLLKGASHLNLPDTALAGAKEFVTLLDRTRAVMREEGLARGILSLIDHSRYLEEVEKTSPTPAAFQVRKEITLELANAAAAFEQGGRRLERESLLDPKGEGGTRKDSRSSGASLVDFLQSASLASDYRANSKEKRFEEDTVRLMTLHSAKGLEFPVVFLVGLEEGLLPHARSMTLDSDVHEERRLFYVGMTRARKHLIITTSALRTVRGRTKSTTESRFLEEIPEELLEFQQTGAQVK